MSKITQDEFSHILTDPAAHYTSPDEVAGDARLTLAQKIEVLSQWAFDERELEVAEEENMQSDGRTIMLDRVLRVLHKLEKLTK